MRALAPVARCRYVTVLGALLALHLGVTQADMIRVTQGSTSRTSAAAIVDDGAAHCHHIARTDVASLPGHHAGTCCDPGQCHCPVFMAIDSPVALQLRVFVRRTSPPVYSVAAPSQRLAPDLRPPIEA